MVEQLLFMSHVESVIMFVCQLTGATPPIDLNAMCAPGATVDETGEMEKLNALKPMRVVGEVDAR
jgi:hypothetical protein